MDKLANNDPPKSIVEVRLNDDVMGRARHYKRRPKIQFATALKDALSLGKQIKEQTTIRRKICRHIKVVPARQFGTTRCSH